AVRQRDDDDVDLPAGEYAADLLDPAEPAHARPLALALVAEQAQHVDAGVPASPQHSQDFGGRLAAADHHRVALVVAAPPGKAQGLPEDPAREAGGDDRGDPEGQDDDAGVVVGAERERHDRDQHQHA